MPRPPRCRRICGAPQVDTFCPNGCENTEPILLTLERGWLHHLLCGQIADGSHFSAAVGQADFVRTRTKSVFAQRAKSD